LDALLMFKSLALKNGVEGIVGTFGRTLSAFKFPPRIARKLQGYVDVRASLDS
jgi:nucleoporin NDC1